MKILIGLNSNQKHLIWMSHATRIISENVDFALEFQSLKIGTDFVPS